MNIKKIAFTAAATAVALSSMATPAFAAPSSCGATHGAFANVNGNFGFLGEAGGTPGYHEGQVGQEFNGTEGATGYNNSHVDCNPQD